MRVQGHLVKSSQPKMAGSGIIGGVIGGIIGGSGNSKAGAGPAQDMSLAPCPCGNDAVWYQTGPPKKAERGSSIGNMTIDNENLCDGCFNNFVAEADRDGWKRLETEHKIDQDRGFGFGDSQDIPADWD